MPSICHITTVHPSKDNRIFHKECKSLHEFGYDVSLIAPHSKDEIIDGISIIPIKKYNNRLLRMGITSFFLLIYKVILTKKDFYHFHDTEIIPAAIILSLFGKKMIYDAHEDISGAIIGRTYLTPILRKILSKAVKIIENFSLKFFSGVVTARPDITEKLNHKNIITLRNFPKLSNLKSIKNVEIKKEKKSVIYVGAMTEIRGIVELINAFQLLDNAELWLLGTFSQAGLLDKCKQLEAWSKVRYFGSVAPNEIFSYIEQADLGICTFKPAPNHMTTLATKPFEYMSCGLPMVLSHFPYWKNFFKDSAAYCDPEDSKDIANSIIQLLSSKNLKAIGQKNKELIYIQYNWEKESKELISFYNNLST